MGDKPPLSQPTDAGPGPARTTRLPGTDELDALVRLKHSRVAQLGWSPRMRARFGYHSPDEVYEALVWRMVGAQTSWLDVGCGRHLFPSNTPLARELAAKAKRLVGVDPDPTLLENPFVHEKVQGFVAELPAEPAFDLVTLRMMAEHVEEPASLCADLAARIRKGGVVVIYTVNRWSPVPLITSLVPFALHQPVKRILWRTEAKDTFPTRFRMNSRASLERWFTAAGFEEAAFAHLDDCRSFARFQVTAFAELALWRALRTLGLGYPETCLLGVYRRR